MIGTAAQVLGYVGTDANGLGGLEQQFEEDLHGTPGHMLTAVDAKRHVLGSHESEPIPGENLVLTIDAQFSIWRSRRLTATWSARTLRAARWSSRTRIPGRYWRWR